jgi:hypothetical protein
MLCKFFSRKNFYFDRHFDRIAPIPAKTKAAKVNLMIEICSSKGVWVVRSEEKMDHQIGSE